jgi:hypothetical protein
MRCPNCGYEESENEYLRRFTSIDSGNHIIAAGRMVGKTRMVISDAVGATQDGDVCNIVAPIQEQMLNISERIAEWEEITKVNKTFFEHNSGGEISLFSSYNIASVGGNRHFPDRLYVDEAGTIPNDIIMGFDSSKSKVNKVSLFYTPSKQRSLLNGFAEYNPTYDTWHIPISAAPHLDDGYKERQYEQLSHRGWKWEMCAEYWGDEKT